MKKNEIRIENPMVEGIDGVGGVFLKIKWNGALVFVGSGAIEEFCAKCLTPVQIHKIYVAAHTQLTSAEEEKKTDPPLGFYDILSKLYKLR